MAQGLREAGYTVTDHVGVYPDGSKAFGVVGLLKNGAGPALLVRGDMDALPIAEETGVAYASHVSSTNATGQQVGVMHACGHDVHTTVLLGTARTLAAANVSDDQQVMGSEDVGVFGLPGHQIPVVYFCLGAMYPDRFAAAKAAGKPLPGPHTSRFEPDPEPTIATGVKVLSAVAIGLLQ